MSRSSKRVLTAAEAASIDFEPIKVIFDTKKWFEQARGLGQVLWVANALVRQTKPELIKAARALLNDNGDNLQETVEGLQFVAEQLKAYAKMIEAAECRLMVACSVIKQEWEAQP